MAESSETRVLILAPLGRDAALARATLTRVGLAAEVCADLETLCAALDQGAGTLLVTQEACSPPTVQRILAALEAQPPWSDLPLVVLVSRGGLSPSGSHLVSMLESRTNVTFLERPVRVATLVSTVQSALRARQRQYEVRDHVQALAQAEEALRRSEERFRIALLHSQVSVFSQDRDLRYTWLHSASPQLPAEAVLGKTDAELLPPAEAARLTSLKQRVLEAGTGAREEINLTLDGRTVHYDLVVEPLRDTTGELQGILGAAIDISERHALERLQREFIAMVSHELKNPLTSIRGQAQLMRRRGAYNERAVDTIVTQADIVRRLVDELLDVSRLEAGRLELYPERLDLTAEAHGYAEQAQAQSQLHQVRVEAAGPLEVWADPARLGQVFLNLLSNALKYSPEGGEIVIRVEAATAEVRISIDDRGVGIPPEALPHLFDRFYRVASMAGRTRGAGLGLYIARGIIEAHGGRIWAHSQGPGTGSTFTFTLPYGSDAPELLNGLEAQR